MDAKRSDRVLVTYATMAGSTAEVAEAIGEELKGLGVEVDVRPLENVSSVDSYDGVVVGGPMIMGWHRASLRFVRKNKKVFARVPVAVFVLAMRLTQSSSEADVGVPLQVDSALYQPPKTPGRLSFKERYARLSSYLRPILRAVQPASIGVFAGRMEYGRLPWWAVIFAMVVVQAEAGDRRDWDAIRAWAGTLPEAFGLGA